MESSSCFASSVGGWWQEWGFDTLGCQWENVRSVTECSWAVMLMDKKTSETWWDMAMEQAIVTSCWRADKMLRKPKWQKQVERGMHDAQKWCVCRWEDVSFDVSLQEAQMKSVPDSPRKWIDRLSHGFMSYLVQDSPFQRGSSQPVI